MFNVNVHTMPLHQAMIVRNKLGPDTSLHVIVKVRLSENEKAVFVAPGCVITGNVIDEDPRLLNHLYASLPNPARWVLIADLDRYWEFVDKFPTAPLEQPQRQSTPLLPPPTRPAPPTDRLIDEGPPWRSHK